MSLRRVQYAPFGVGCVALFTFCRQLSSPCSFFFFNDPATTEIYTLSYTTLFRSWSARALAGDASVRRYFRVVLPDGGTRMLARSEEHTSELQSPMYLVCRLLLEKKKHSITARYCTSSVERRIVYSISTRPPI